LNNTQHTQHTTTDQAKGAGQVHQGAGGQLRPSGQVHATVRLVRGSGSWVRPL
jgi:hypothetical protein